MSDTKNNKTMANFTSARFAQVTKPKGKFKKIDMRKIRLKANMEVVTGNNIPRSTLKALSPPPPQRFNSTFQIDDNRTK